MELEQLLDAVFTIVGGLLLIIYNGMRGEMKDLRLKVDALQTQLSKHEADVAGRFVTRQELQESVRSMDSNLKELRASMDKGFDRLHERLDEKASR